MSTPTLTAATRAVTDPPAPAGTRRLFAAGAPDLAHHAATFGPLPHPDSAALVDEVQAAGLAGRGGAAFPAWRKIASAQKRAGTRDRVVVIGNGAEGEPMSAKDATLLQRAPHLVIDGLLLAGAAVGATELYLYTGAAALASVRAATLERSDARGIVLREAPDSFISGEASAVIHSIEKGRAIPRDHVVRLTTSGLRGRPTLLHNVETLAHLALVARYGADWFRSVGSREEPGTRLFTVRAPDGLRVIEAAGGVSIAEAVSLAGVDPRGFSAVLVGGYHGGWVRSEHLGRPLTREALQEFGAAPGAGILMGLPVGSCGLTAAAQIARYLASQSARQCGPCVNGLPELASVLTRLASGRRDPGLPAEVRRLAGIVTGRGSCHHPDGTARFVLSTLTAFADDVEAHLAGHCLGGAA
ncbi:NADH-ubiquinone oxidoreductase-F iron-sulfur binding region domain-containing protein [Galbitalea soli]|uniref:NADH-quinone oxidoreductase subunit F n=1 Tax=Galbitalea soli TaxID=1268042 RepID=A0A7C9PKN5_9MICO|nr:NADH-ubiquinone oxidoreductase-F iron-sulfur binding region domain-containing protein [Galbitalea soli]NEM89786.1 NADH-quinone oxidoreductase subunit F [Galbitalea soli]NYJ30489.1 NADH:ubiquinone oxidoreductase subunit F (NADH-binding) [Galbitalea soli]